ncbi:MAG: hypothetical protein ABEI52_01865, partial [Halobacteriaceae archaeon]
MESGSARRREHHATETRSVPIHGAQAGGCHSPVHTVVWRTDLLLSVLFSATVGPGIGFGGV